MLRTRGTITSRILSVVITLCLVFASFSVTEMTAAAAVNTYYVDSISGNDSNNGTSTGTPWKSLSKVNSTVFQPGDQILFKKGSVWTGTLEVSSSGNSGAQIVYGAYGTGSRPIINGNGSDQAILVYGKSYVTIRDLEITNPAAERGDRKGIFIVGYAGANNGIQILNNDIHHVKGKYGESDYFHTGAISADSYSYNADDLLIEGNSIHDNECEGMLLSGSGDLRYHNLRIRNNTLNYNVKGDIIISKALNPVIEHNIGMNAGQGYTGFYYIASMWEWGCDGSTFQYNEVANVKAADLSWGGDSMAFDVDIESKGTHVFQYNYSHNNAGGTFLVMENNPELASSIFRYNISQNDGHYNCSPWDNNQTWDGTKGSTVQVNNPGSNGTYIYNNVWYSNTQDGIWLKDKTANFYNNIFYSSGNNKYPTTGPIYDYNCFYGGTAPSTDAHKITANPNFVNAGSGGIGLNSVDGYKLQSNSPCINSGKAISNNGGKDYWGNSLYVNAPDIGAYEYNGGGATPTPTSTPTPTPTPIPGGYAHAGSYAVKADYTTGDLYKYFVQYRTVTANTNYAGEIWIKGSGTLVYEIDDTSTWNAISTVTVTGSDTWTKFVLPAFNTGSRTNVAVIVKIVSSSSGTLYIDDMVFGTPGGANILEDPGFETGTTWMGITTAPFSRIYSSAPVAGNVHTGSYAVKADYTTGDLYKYFVQYRTVTANTNYTGEIWVKGSGTIVYEIDDTSTWNAISTVTIAGSDTWTKFVLPVFNTGSRTNAAVIVKIVSSSPGTLYIDDAVFGTSGGINILEDPSFEAGTTWLGISAPFSRITN